MKVELVSLSQDLDLKTGCVTDYCVLRMPSGRTLRAVIEEEVVKEIIAATQLGQVDAERSILTEPDDTEAMVRSPARPPQQRRVLVGKDSMGNPVFEGDNAPQMFEQSIDDDQDEDGVGQL